MAPILLTANQFENLELAYDGYDPTWIIGTHNDPLPPGSYGPYAAAARYNSMQASQYRSHFDNSYRGLFNDYDPHRRMHLPSYYGPAATPQILVPGPQARIPGPGPGIVVKASKVAPIPSVTTVIYPHGHGHALGTGHGYKTGLVQYLLFTIHKKVSISFLASKQRALYLAGVSSNIVIMKVPYCCQGCEEKWKDKLTEIPGFKGVNVDRRHEGMVLRATVFGDMDTHSVVKTIQKYQPRAELWGGAQLR